jgi:iduronate 2-sulfatase
MERREFLKTGGAALGGIAASSASVQSVRGMQQCKPNVLFISIEDLQNCFGCYGNDVCQTPNIDALAERSMRFDNAACQYPVCNPSRSSLLSGVRPATTGVWGNSTNWNEHLKSGTTLPEFMRQNGYDTTRVGKIFHAGNSGRVYDDSARWDRVIPEGEGITPSGKKRRPFTYLYDKMSAEERDKDYNTRAWYWGATGTDDTDESDGKVAEQAVRYLENPPDKPFFLAVGFHKPHLALLAPDKYFDMYDVDKIPLPKYPENDLDDLPSNLYSLKNHKTFTDRKRREAIAAYYACVSFVDAGVGRVLKALRDSGQEENTIIMLWGDHGFHIGEHHLWQKSTLYEESARVPMIIKAPGLTPAGSVCARPVELVDMYQTIAELCGLSEPQDLEGLSMAPLLKNPKTSWKKGAFTYRSGGPVTVRTERWRYTEWRAPDQNELYDHESDPKELTNLATLPKYADKVAELRALLHGDWKAAFPD